MDKEYVPVDEIEECASKEEFVLEMIGKCTCRPCSLSSKVFRKSTTVFDRCPSVT